jgi:iron complex outermembrane receptor protein
MKKKILAYSCIFLALQLCAEETKLNTLTVTADKQGEKNIEKIPGTVSVLNDMKIDDYQIKNTTDLVTMTPSFYITKAGPSSADSFAAMRGVSGSMTGTPSVGFYVDDIYYTSFYINLFDIERIEILKGPQGTLYGRNSEAGVINIITKKPKKYDNATISMDYSSFNTVDTSFLFNKVINDTTILRAALQYSNTDGYFTNQYTNDDEVGKEENQDFRVFLYKKINDSTNLTLNYNRQKDDSPNYAQFAPYNDSDLRKKIDVDYLGKSEKEADGINAKIDYTGEDIKILSVSSFRKEKINASNDIDFTPTDLMDLTIDRKVKNISEELRFISNQNSRFQWIGGLFILSEKDDKEYNTRMNFANMGMSIPAETLNQTSETKTLGTALFSEVSTVWLDTKITLGLRYDREEKDFSYSQKGIGGTGALASMGYPNEQGSKSAKFDAWLPKLSLTYQGFEQITPYFSIARGFKSGGFNAVDNIGSSYEPEFTLNYELGLKYAILNNFHINTSLFYISWDDIQVEIPTAGGTSTYIDNASEATSKGAEVELAYILDNGIDISMGASYVDAKYDSYKKGAIDYSGKHIIDAPKMTFNIGTIYRDVSGFYIGANYAYFQDVYFNNSNTKSQSYGITNAKIGYEANDFDIYLYSNNIFDKGYKTRAFEVSNKWYARAGEPRVVGLAFKYRF